MLEFPLREKMEATMKGRILIASTLAALWPSPAA
jgi:hypothetical protein